MRGPYVKTIDAATARLRFRYFKSTGVLMWRYCESMSSSWNARFAETLAGTVNPKGYRIVRVNGGSMMVHRIIWLIVTGDWPEEEIDHRNKIRNDNRWKNLRECSHLQNGWNRTKNRKNTTGHRGIHWCRRARKFIVQVRAGNKRTFYRFDTLDEAIHARNVETKKLHGRFASIV